MTVSVAIENANNEDNFGFLTMPFASNCLGYYLFGGNQASSVKNLIAGGADLSATVGAGGTVYTSNSVDLKQGSYFRTPYTVPGKNWTAIYVWGGTVQELCYEAQDATNRWPPIYGMAEMDTSASAVSRSFTLVDAGGTSSVFQSWQGATILFRPGTNPNQDVLSSNYTLPSIPVGFPDGTIRPAPQLMVASVGTMDSYQMVQSGRAMVRSSIPNGAVIPPNNYVEVGCRNASSASAHCYLYGMAIFNRQLTPSEALLASSKLCADLADRGVFQFSSLAPDLSTSAAGDVGSELVFPTLDLDFKTMTELPPYIDFTRTSAGGYFDASGVYQWTPASKNLLTYTEEFDNAAWAKTRASITANGATSPLGLLSADTLVEDTTSSATHSTSVALSLSAGTYTVSCYLKAAGRSWAQLKLLNTTNAYANFNLATGVVGGVGAAATATITPIVDGWFRCTFTATVAAGANTLSIYSGSADNVISYTGNGLASLYLWGAQIEQAGSATSYTRNYGGLYPARLHKDPVSGLRGFLVEPPRTNKFLQSGDFTVAPWAATVTGTSTRTNETRADLGFPVGVITATSANGGLRQAVTGLTSGQPHAVSFYVESTSTSVLVVLENGTSAYGTSCNVTINPSNGGVGTITGFTSVTSRPHKTGYYYTVILPNAAGTLAANFEWRITNSGDVVRIGAPQLEQGPSASTYIPTTSTVAARSNDLPEIRGPNFASIFNVSEGTIVIEFVPSALPPSTATARVFEVNDGAVTTRVPLLYITNLGGGAAMYRVAGVDQAFFSGATGAFTPGALKKIAFGYKADDFGVSFAGAATQTDTSGSILPGPTQMSIGYAYSSTSEPLNGIITRLRYYPARLPNNKLRVLSQ